MILLDAVLEYAARGWAVLPLHTITAGKCSCKNPKDCESPGKHPRILGGVKQASKIPAQLHAWWKRWPDANIGIATGSVSGFYALDVDGEEGARELKKHVIPPTPVVRTGTGWHYLFAAPNGAGEPVRNRAGIVPGLDIRGDDGYIVAPPSRHVSGRLYTWIIPLTDFSPADPPFWLQHLLRTNARTETIPQVVPEGTRNTVLTSLAGSMRRRGASHATILAALEVENKKCNPPLESQELAKISRSISRYSPAVVSDCLANSKQEQPANSAQEHLTDSGNALRLVRLHGENLCYCYPWGRWLRWSGQNWQRDTTGEVERMAVSVIRDLYASAAAEPDETKRKALAKYAIASESAKRRHDLVSLARCELAISPDLLDMDQWKLNVLNGTLDLRTSSLLPHNRTDKITKIAPVEYDSTATCPTWFAFLNRIMAQNADILGFLQRAIGYSLTGDVSEQVLFFLHGQGANGKTTLLSTVRAMLGPDYAQEAAPDLLMTRYGDHHPTEAARLHGIRLCVTAEVEQGRRLAEVVAKQLTGGDRIVARYMREDFFEFDPTHKLFMAGNHRPEIRGTDLAIWRRIRLIPFDVAIPAAEQEKHLPEKLKEELPGILAWAVRGCLEWQQHGLGTPAEVSAATSQYRAEEDVLGGFIGECCLTGPAYSTRAKDLLDAYHDWTGDTRITAHKFGRALAEKGFQKRKHGTIHWDGIGLRDTEDFSLQPPF